MYKKQYSILYCFLFWQLLILSYSYCNAQKDMIDLYFVMNKDACTSCAQGAIKNLTTEFNKFNNISKVNVLININSPKYLKWLKQYLNADSVYLPKNGFDYFNGVKVQSSYDIFCVDHKSNIVIKHFTDFTDETHLDISNPIVTEYPMADNDSIIPMQMGSPYIDEKNSSIYFLLPETSIVACYNMNTKTFLKSIKENGTEDFIFYDSTKHNMDYWKLTKKMVGNLCNIVCIYDISDTACQTINYGVYDYVKMLIHGDSNLIWVRKYYIADNVNGKINTYLLTKNFDTYFIPNKNKIYKTFEDVNTENTLIVPFCVPKQLNNSIKVVEARDSLHRLKLIFVDYQHKNTYAVEAIDSLVKQQNEITSCSDKNNHLFVYNELRGEIVKYHFNGETVDSIQNYQINTEQSDTNKIIFKILYHNDKIYVFWIYQNTCLSVEEYTADNLKFIKSLKLDTLNKINNVYYDIAGFYKNKIIAYTKNNNDEWLLKAIQFEHSK